MSYRSGASSHKGHRSHKSKARTGAKVSRSRSRSASRKNKKSTRGKCVAGRIRDHRTHKCATCDDFDPVEVAQFLRLLGVAVSADHKENCRTLRAAVKPDRFDEVAKILMGVRKFDPLPGQDIYEERKAPQRKPTLSAAERVGLSKPVPLPPRPPTPPSLIRDVAISVSPKWTKNAMGKWVASPSKFFEAGGIYSPSKADYDLYEDDYFEEDDDDDIYEEDDIYEGRLNRRLNRKKNVDIYGDDDLYENDYEDEYGDYDDFGFSRSALNSPGWQQRAKEVMGIPPAPPAPYDGSFLSPSAGSSFVPPLQTPGTVEMDENLKDLQKQAEEIAQGLAGQQ